MKKILVLAIALVFSASSAYATLAVRETCSSDRTAPMSAARASLSEDGVEKLQQIFDKASALEDGKGYVFSMFFFEPALRPDLKRSDLKRIRKFLKTISVKRLVTCNVIGGSSKFKGRGEFHIVYTLEERDVTEGDRKAEGMPAAKTYATALSGKKYFIEGHRIKKGEKRESGSRQFEIRLDK